MLKFFLGNFQKSVKSWAKQTNARFEKSKVTNLLGFSSVSKGRKACKADCQGCHGDNEECYLIATFKPYDKRMLKDFQKLNLKPGDLIQINRRTFFFHEKNFKPLRYNSLQIQTKREMVQSGEVMMFLGFKDYEAPFISNGREVFTETCARWLYKERNLIGWFKSEYFEIIKLGQGG